MEDLIGNTVMTDINTSAQTSTAMKGKSMVLLYFSASWCPPCRAFTPLLTEFYEKCCKPNGVEIVFISSDRDIQSFNEYFGKMPWMSLPEGDKQTQAKLSKTFEVNGIPHLLVLDARTGHFVTHNAKGEVANVAGDAEKGNALIRSWKAMESVPVNDAVFAEKKFSIRTVVAFVLKHPMFIVALIYFRPFEKLKNKLGL